MKKSPKKTYNKKARAKLKQDLFLEQAGKCALSGAYAMDLHEVIVKRGDYPFPAKQDAIFVRENSILISREQHSRSDFNKMQKECCEWLLKKYGYQKIRSWFDGLGLRTIKSVDHVFAKYGVEEYLYVIPATT